MLRYSSFTAQGWRGEVLAGWEDMFIELDEWLASSVGERVVNLPSRQVWRAETSKGAVFVKVIYRASEVNSLVRKTFSSLKWLLRPSRALATLKVSRAMLLAGFDCPVPVLAVRRRSAAGWPVDVFVSAECRYLNLYEQMLDLNREHKEALLSQVASELNRFHCAGFVHGDCITPNLALNGQGRLVLFDNDRTVRAPMLRRRYAQRRNLIQFGYRLTRQQGSSCYFELFLNSYVAAGKGAADREHIPRILRAVNKRLRNAR
ncbi:lipopolysaccharide kinase InaA family protein [Pseudomonas flexibilis]|uniref:Lipopolysaccharide kinase (Kdo/WaaP) family protein n=1 Tax=Pseudomonas flexibilis TaxID=706570 RepID=A0A1N6WCS6_9PSED|nr:lipopolysaccharide kinase InaA family protein [Pseudomonas flexibilis]SIQ87894.1 Lipopolysaccharide kinase (Kdo/WaaP) family protein [Pseudomonas flexibilis]